MRLIGNIPNNSQAERFSAYLSEKGIQNLCEGGQIWVADEDRLLEAGEELKRFSLNPSDPHYDTKAPIEEAKEEPQPKPARRVRAPLTSFLLALCIFVYVLNYFQELKMAPKEGEGAVMTPVQKELLFEAPPAPYWQGIYEIVSLKFRGKDVGQVEGPLFTQIGEGEVWRLFTPCILHLNFLHILFNMLWLWMLGRPIEARIGSFRLLFLTLAIGVLTNTAQYLMSGPLFLGFSGVVTGWAGFIWMREKIAPWEGYPVQRSAILFLAIFIFAMLGLQAVSFILTVFTSISFPLNIANTAHIGGYLLGVLFGRLPCFAWRVR